MNHTRFHDMDFCRAIFMYCGILFHCGLIYGSGQDWRVVSDQTSGLLGLLSNFLHHFRMEAFYLVSGFFYALIFAKGRANFLQERVTRALVPMLVVGFTLNFAMNYLSDNRHYQFNLDYFISGKWQAHLWFLGNLIVYFVVSIGLIKKLTALDLKDKPQTLVRNILVLFALALIAQAVSNALSFTTVLFVNFGYLFYFYAFFVMGLIAFIQREAFYQLVKVKWFLVYLSMYALLQGLCIVFSEWDPMVKAFIKQVSHLPLMLAAFAFLCFVGSRKSKFIRFISDASYTIYLFHQPLLIIFYVYLFAHIQLGAIYEYVLLVTLVLLVSSLIHIYIVERFKLAKFLLNGTKATPSKHKMAPITKAPTAKNHTAVLNK